MRPIRAESTSVTRIQKIERRRSRHLVIETARYLAQPEGLALSRPVHAEHPDAALDQSKRAPKNGDLLGAVQPVEKGDVWIVARRVFGRKEVCSQGAFLVGNVHALEPGNAVLHPLLIVGQELSVGFGLPRGRRDGRSARSRSGRWRFAHRPPSRCACGLSAPHPPPGPASCPTSRTRRRAMLRRRLPVRSGAFPI